MSNNTLTRYLAVPLALWALTAPAAQPGPAAADPKTSAAKSQDLFADTLVAKGKGVSVKRSDLDNRMVSIKGSITARGQAIPPSQMQMLEQQVLDQMITVQVLLTKATDDDKAVGKAVSTQQVDELKDRAKTEEALNRYLKAMGTTLDELRAKVMEQATAQNVLERELNIKVADSEVKKFYDDNPAQFEQPEMVRVAHILIGTKDPATGADLPDDKKAAKRKLADEVLKKARDGVNFAELVKEYSDDPGSKDSGGEYTFARASADPSRAMVKEFEDAAFALKVNEISDLVPTQFGYHIIKSLEKIPARKTEFAKVSTDIKNYLKAEQIKSRQQDYRNFMEKLRKEDEVVILDEKLRLPPPPPEPPANSAPKTEPKPER